MDDYLPEEARLGVTHARTPIGTMAWATGPGGSPGRASPGG